ncbi:hypothetical protein E4T39_03906 [Aureobasidium subglaciale]|nr:hypothetical protein E4T39_03906 [Aureobasidium subglaciale]
MVTARRNLSFPPVEPAATTINSVQLAATTINSVQPSAESIQAVPKPFIALATTSVEAEEEAMNSQKEAELLAIQHVLGLKDATDDSVKIKPKDRERLERLKAAEPVFVCVDLEAYEFSQDKITEVGVSVLDSRDVVGTDSGTDGMAWLSKIKTRHMIIQEYKHLVNKRFVHGCPDKFNFGESEIVSLRNIHQTLTQLFDNPSPGSSRPSDTGTRRLILVGHGLSHDTAYLNKLKFAPHARGNIIQDVDTQKFVGSKKQTVGLNKLMLGLGVEAENLHNAGNDAAYTLQALILMTVQHTNEPGAYINAVANAKAKLDPAKQRYKDHIANLAKMKNLKRAGNVATAPPVVETQALPNSARGPTMAQLTRTPIDLTRSPATWIEHRAKEKAAEDFLQKTKGEASSFKRTNLGTHDNHASFPAPMPSVGSSKPESSSKRKSSDAVNHNIKHAKASSSTEHFQKPSHHNQTPAEDDDFSISPAFASSAASRGSISNTDQTAQSSGNTSVRITRVHSAEMRPAADFDYSHERDRRRRQDTDEAAQPSFTITKVPSDNTPTENAAEYMQTTKTRGQLQKGRAKRHQSVAYPKTIKSSTEIAPSKFVDELAKLKNETLQHKTANSGEMDALKFLNQEVQAHRKKRAEDERRDDFGP